MKQYIFSNICRKLYLWVSLPLLAMTLSCTDELKERYDSYNESRNIAFSGFIDQTSSIRSRAGEIIPVNPDDFGKEFFYIYEKGEEEDAQAETTTPTAKVGVYWLSSGNEGMLEEHSDPEKLNWFAPGTKHRFWSWTWPLKEKSYKDVDLATQSDDISEVLTFISSEFPLPDNEPKTVDEPGEPEEGENTDVVPEPEVPVDPAMEWRNGEALERLVGTISDRQYVFIEDGRYVPLTYKHLVSRIVLGDFWLIDNGGSTQKELQAKITFYGMPKRAMFFPKPEAVTNDAGEDEEVAPYVIIDITDPYGKQHTPSEKTNEVDIKNALAQRVPATESEEVPLPFDYDLTQYLSFYILNQGGDDTNTGTNPDADANVDRDIFYICPEIDFGELEYKVEFVEYDKEKNAYVPHHRYGVKGGYFGNFKAIQFIRGEEGSEEYTTDRVLHAGEEMVLNMTVYEKSGPGAGVWIRNWNTNKLKSATHHTHQGIYSDGESSLFRTAMANNNGSNANTNATYDQQKQAAFDMYGDPESPDEYLEEQENDEKNRQYKITRMYNDITYGTSAASTTTQPSYPIYDDTQGNHYILDGMGFTMTFVNTNTSGPSPFEYVTIGDVRDIYLSNGETTVYIDKQGYIWRMNKKTGEYENTNEKHNPNSKLYFDPK